MSHRQINQLRNYQSPLLLQKKKRNKGNQIELFANLSFFLNHLNVSSAIPNQTTGINHYMQLVKKLAPKPMLCHFNTNFTFVNTYTYGYWCFQQQHSHKKFPELLKTKTWEDLLYKALKIQMTRRSFNSNTVSTKDNRAVNITCTTKLKSKKSFVN